MLLDEDAPVLVNQVDLKYELDSFINVTPLEYSDDLSDTR